jgi:hypothetical protein
VSFESDFFDAIKSLVSNRVYPTVAPLNTTRPYITYQLVGGTAWNFLENTAVGKRHARVQVNCWATTKLAVAALARSVEDALVTSTTIRAFVNGAVVDDYNEDLQLYGTRQDFSASY